MRRLTRLALAAVLLTVGPSTMAFAQDKTPPSWQTLVRCAEKGDPDEELACYRAAMKDAGYAPTSEANAQRRRKFGLSLPSMKFAGHSDKEKPAKTAQAGPAPATEAAGDDDSRVTVELETLALIPPANKMMMVTKDGAIWQQLDTEAVTPMPKPGQQFQIERNKFGGYFCKFDKFTKVRCMRTH